MFWNRRIVRITVGVLLLGAAVVALLPGITGYTSLDGTINARFSAISAPIDGKVLRASPKLGTYVPSGNLLLMIRNERVNRGVEDGLVAELQATRSRSKALKSERQELLELHASLEQRLNDYHTAMVDYLRRQIAITRTRVEIHEARRVSDASEAGRQTSLQQRNINSARDVERARAAAVASEGEVEVERLTLQRLQGQLMAMEEGIFIGDTYNDVPYSRQRMDELTMQIARLDSQIAEQDARVVELTKQLDAETARVADLELAAVRMPFNGVIWRNQVVAGSNVFAGNELLRVLDCRDIFVDILVPEVDFDEIYPGRVAAVRLYGADEVIAGTVTSVLGNAAIVEEVTLAAIPPRSEGRNARIRLALAQSDLNTDHANFCQVGRSVQVRFRALSLSPGQWLRNLWFSIM